MISHRSQIRRSDCSAEKLVDFHDSRSSRPAQLRHLEYLAEKPLHFQDGRWKASDLCRLHYLVDVTVEQVDFLDTH